MLGRRALDGLDGESEAERRPVGGVVKIGKAAQGEDERWHAPACQPPEPNWLRSPDHVTRPNAVWQGAGSHRTISTARVRAPSGPSHVSLEELVPANQARVRQAHRLQHHDPSASLQQQLDGRHALLGFGLATWVVAGTSAGVPSGDHCRVVEDHNQL